ncbi:uncharacterized protein ASPGLDRAFT_1393985 [Aspergillus glaucus CBS 516.65]|uniref:CCHC-type domain-containing protein n=1 Tax=Aspergillus glaucus CBS 516.65 TaxID=1160497 RepID=A0A1L9V3A4_ASPGL|nr:hypothetical protein ASPGLDRAFT_1393985 [Aspergillus glaucus CBS 516.65]OJJ78407.1 hypothetical protein ASPGLDRAFT_1393985 [Aspergillus glaucus CBS 516.65]
MKEGRCFHCQERGHLARDCPTKSSTPELKEEKVSNLGLDGVDLGELDLSQLIGGKGFNVNSQVAYNGISIPDYSSRHWSKWVSLHGHPASDWTGKVLWNPNTTAQHSYRYKGIQQEDWLSNHPCHHLSLTH